MESISIRRPAGGLVDKVDRLVGQEALGDVAVAQDGRRDERGVGDADAVVDLVSLAQAAENADGVLDAGLVDDDRLESALERGVLLDVLAVLVQRRGADGVELATGQHRLQQVRGIHGALRGAGADHGVQLVDEQDDGAVRVGDLLEHRLEAFLELAAVLRAGDQGAKVQGHHPSLPKPIGHVAAHDALGQALGDGRLADPRLADEDRVVLRSAAQDLDDATDLLVAADHRVEHALACRIGQVTAVLLECLVGGLRVICRHALAPSDLGERREHGIGLDARRSQCPCGLAVSGLQGREQQMLGGYEFVLHALRHRVRIAEDPAGLVGELQLLCCAADLRKPVERRPK